jgi:hypothetical protein
MKADHGSFPFGASSGAARGVRALGLVASLGLLVQSTGCAEVRQYNRDTVLSSKTLRTLAADWSFGAAPQLAVDSDGRLSSVQVAVQKDKACVVNEVREVDRTLVTEKRMLNEVRSRRMGYTIGGLGATGALPAYILAVQTKNDDERLLFGVIAGIGTYLSITMIIQIAREFDAIDHEEHLGKLDLYEKRRERCDLQPAAGVRVRLVRAGAPALAEGVADAKGGVVLAVEPGAIRSDAIYAVEVDGKVVQHVELAAPKPALPVAAPGVTPVAAPDTAHPP